MVKENENWLNFNLNSTPIHKNFSSFYRQSREIYCSYQNTSQQKDRRIWSYYEGRPNLVLSHLSLL